MCIYSINVVHAETFNLQKRILSSGGLFSVESMPGKAAATLRNNLNMQRRRKKIVEHFQCISWGFFVKFKT